MAAVAPTAHPGIANPRLPANVAPLANPSLDGEGVSFRELAEEPTFYGEHLVSGLPLPRGHDPWFTVRAEGDECVVEWVRDDPPRPDRRAA